MKTIIEYLDELKTKTGSDYKTAKLMEIARESVSQIRKRGTVADETAIKMADLLGIDRQELLIAAAIARSEGETKQAWLSLSKRAGIAAGLLICIATTGEIIAPITHLTQTAYYVKLWMRSRS